MFAKEKKIFFRENACSIKINVIFALLKQKQNVKN